ncbi:MAG: hypothetical protein U5R06_03415 [candidate division KSB1 bacterium]|nr:hypothetical protein [candidate division KSB1 bacterium]
MTDSSHYVMKDSRIENGFITVALMGDSRGTLSRVDTPGEFLCMGRNALEFTDCEFLLQWLVLPDSAEVDMTLPEQSPLSWSFSDCLRILPAFPIRFKSITAVMSCGD